VKFAFIHAEKAVFPVLVLCEVLGVSTSGYYAWIRRPRSRRAAEDARLGAAIAASHARSRRTYGRPRILADLRAQGERVSGKRVARLMRQRGLASIRRPRFTATTDSQHKQPVAPNLLQRAFKVKAMNTVWVGDVTYIWTWAGWLYLAAVIDLASRRVVGWATSENNDRVLALKALDVAVRCRRPRRGLVHHTDRGSPYASRQYRTALKRIGAVASMSRTGDCWDNAVAESFFGTLRAELLDHERYETRAAAEAAVRGYIEGFYNPTRRHSSIGYLSPMEFELRLLSASRAA
jgi:putative transposase